MPVRIDWKKLAMIKEPMPGGNPMTDPQDKVKELAKRIRVATDNCDYAPELFEAVVAGLIRREVRELVKALESAVGLLNIAVEKGVECTCGPNDDDSLKDCIAMRVLVAISRGRKTLIHWQKEDTHEG